MDRKKCSNTLKIFLALSLLGLSPAYAGQSVTGNLLVSGNVGVGTATPAGSVDVGNGSICIAGSCKSAWSAASQWTGTSPIYYNGNVGVGSTNPGGAIDVGTGTVCLSHTCLSSWPGGSGGVDVVTASLPLTSSGGASPNITLSTAGTWSGNAGTATALASTPSLCSAGSAPRGVDTGGNASGCAVLTTGTVTSVSVATNNGFAGSVSSATTTPSITLSTTVNGMVKGNATTLSAATSGVDYAPATSGSNILYGNGSGGFSNVTIGTGLNFSAGTLSNTIIPSGLIAMWSGTVATIPAGWVLCDGSNSTPDLRDRFIVGAKQDSGGVAKTNVTGSLTQSGNGQLPATTVNVQWYKTNNASAGSASSLNSLADPFSPNRLTTDITATSISFVNFGTGSVNVAVYYALAFIMKT